MPRLALFIGLLLVLLGVGGYVYALATADEGGGYASWTALIPAIAGVPLIILGGLALVNPGWRKHLMHVAVAWALLGALAPLGRLPAGLRADPINVVAVSSLLGMLVLCAIFVIAGIRSFIAARKERQAGLEVVPRS